MEFQYSTLDELLKKKLEHEEKAKKKLIDHLKKDESSHQPLITILERGSFNSEQRIVVFGRSGVGKTTLILKLLGAKEPKEDDEGYNILELARNLRGNIEAGGAGTATVIRYEIGDDDTRGEVVLPNKEPIRFEKLETVREVLDSIREKVESHEWKHIAKPVRIKLPARYFDRNIRNDWVITDIPGINSTSKSEYSHVSEIVNAYVKTCSALLVVEKANNVSQLDRLNVSGLGNWRLLGKRAHLIISHSFKSESVTRHFEYYMKNNSSLSLEELKKYFIEEEFKRQQFHNIGGVYPLDYGTSWEQLKEAKKAIFNFVKDTMAKMIDELRKSLADSIKPENEFKILVDFETIENNLKNKIKSLENKKDKLEKKEKAFCIEKSKLKIKKEKINKKKVKQEKIIKELGTKRAAFSKPELNEEDIKSNLKSREDCSNLWITKQVELKKQISEYYNEILNKPKISIYNLINSKYLKYLNKERFTSLCKCEKDEQYPFLHESWMCYCKDKKVRDYRSAYNSLSQNFIQKFGKDIRELQKDAVVLALKKEYKFWQNFINKVINNEITKNRKKLKKEINKDNNRISIIKKIRDNYDARIKQLTEKKEPLDNEIENLNSNIENVENIILKNDYPRFRRQKLAKQVKCYIKKAENSDNSLDYFQYLAFCQHIIEISEAISNSK